MDEHLRRMEVRDENMLHLHHHHDGQAEFQVLRRFRSSVAFCRLVHFVADVCEASRGKSVSEAAETHKHSTGVARLLALLDKIESLVAQVEPLKTVTRFGNPAFKVGREKREETTLTSRKKKDFDWCFARADWIRSS